MKLRRKFSMRTILRAFVALASVVSTPVFADTMIEAVPTAWRLQDYMNGALTTWYTGSSCASGQLILDVNAPADSKNRYWSLVMSAKMANKPIGVYYTVVNGGCYITNFYLKEQ